jgi:hypothetical protein
VSAEEEARVLRAALRALLDGTTSARTCKAQAARAEAHRIWLETTPPAARWAALSLAQQRNPSILTFEAAIRAYGTLLLSEIHP